MSTVVFGRTYPVVERAGTILVSFWAGKRAHHSHSILLLSTFHGEGMPWGKEKICSAPQVALSVSSPATSRIMWGVGGGGGMMCHKA